MPTVFSSCILIFIFAFFIACSFASSTITWNKAPRQFRMQVYSKPFRKGVIQNIRTHAETNPDVKCWNLSSKRVGSYELNDPLVKVTFYKLIDCKGSSSAAFRNSLTPRDHVLIRARSVLVTRVKPVLLQHRLQKEF